MSLWCDSSNASSVARAADDASEFVRRSRRLRLRGWCCLTTFVLGGCYQYVPITSTPNVQEVGAAFELTDVGRVNLSDRIGPEVSRISGLLVRSTDTAYVLRVSEVRDLGGVVSRWAGEEISLRQDYVKRVYERRFSLGRTLMAAGAAVGTVVAIAITRSLLGGGGTSNGPPGGPPGEEK
jgi:hypothetical protein